MKPNHFDHIGLYSQNGYVSHMKPKVFELESCHNHDSCVC